MIWLSHNAAMPAILLGLEMDEIPYWHNFSDEIQDMYVEALFLYERTIETTIEFIQKRITQHNEAKGIPQ